MDICTRLTAASNRGSTRVVCVGDEPGPLGPGVQDASRVFSLMSPQKKRSAAVARLNNSPIIWECIYIDDAHGSSLLSLHISLCGLWEGVSSRIASFDERHNIRDALLGGGSPVLLCSLDCGSFKLNIGRSSSLWCTWETKIDLRMGFRIADRVYSNYALLSRQSTRDCVTSRILTVFAATPLLMPKSKHA